METFSPCSTFKPLVFCNQPVLRLSCNFPASTYMHLISGKQVMMLMTMCGLNAVVIKPSQRTKNFVNCAYDVEKML